MYIDMETQLKKFRGAGWLVAVHNDYKQRGKTHTFWLFTHPNGCYVKGEGRTDKEALKKAWAEIRSRFPMTLEDK